MADVPGWLLVANTIIVGALGFLPNLVEPKKDRKAREHAARQQAESYLAIKIEEVATVNDLAAAKASELLLSEVDRILRSKTPILSIEVLNLLYGPQRMVAVHFPFLLPIFDKARDEQSAATRGWAELVQAANGNADAALATTKRIIFAQTQAFSELRLRLIDVAIELAEQRAKSSGVRVKAALQELAVASPPRPPSDQL